MNQERIKQACEILLTTCSASKPEEKLLFVTDPTSQAVAQAMWDNSSEFPYRSLVMMTERTMHGQEPNPVATVAMAEADVIFGITKFSLFHSNARRHAVAKGARFVNMVDYQLSMLEEGGLFVDFDTQGQVCKEVGERFLGEKVRITSPAGTDLQASISGRKTVPQFGRSLKPGDSSSPPDIECANCAVEETAEGMIVIDGSIPHPLLGLIHEPIHLRIVKGAIVAIEGGEQARILADVLAGFEDENVYKVGEIGIGLNPECCLNGRMLEDEGCGGTMHFGFGSNTGFFGKLESPYHLDMVLRLPTIEVDGRVIVERGNVTLE